MSKHYQEIDSVTQLFGLIAEPRVIEQYVFQNIDFTDFVDRAELCTYKDCLFLGCVLPESLELLVAKDNLIFPTLDAPYNVYRGFLYSANSLYEGFDPDDESTFDSCFDHRVHEHYLATGKVAKNVRETLARSLHDHSMSNALYDFLRQYHERQFVGIMGGHDLLRTDLAYRKIVYLSKALTEQGFIMVSGGGAGAMEATHLGAWMAERTEAEVEEALAMVETAPGWQDPHWLKTAFDVIGRFKQTHFVSLGIPTWLYGHEPATPLATHIAKYFDNSIREDTLLNICRGGLVFAPGSAGTLQEIFQAAVPNHYGTFGYGSPMTFLGKDFWTKEVPVYRLLDHLVKTGTYDDLLLSISDDVSEIISTIKAFRPKEKAVKNKSIVGGDSAQ